MAFSAFSIFPRFGLIAALAVLAACGDGRDTTGGSGAPRRGPQGPVAVIAQVVEFKTAQQQLEAVGTARARRSVVLYPPTAGEVTAVNFAAGDFVKAGDVLLELDARQERFAVDLAKVAVDEARQLLERYQRIEDTGAISASQIDEAKTALVGARIQLEQAQVALADRSLKAPFDGFLGVSQIDLVPVSRRRQQLRNWMIAPFCSSIFQRRKKFSLLWFKGQSFQLLRFRTRTCRERPRWLPLTARLSKPLGASWPAQSLKMGKTTCVPV